MTGTEQTTNFAIPYTAGLFSVYSGLIKVRSHLEAVASPMAPAQGSDSYANGGRVGNPGDRYLLEAFESEGVLRAYLLRNVRNPADVDELLQETYARLLVADPASGAVRSVRALALPIAGNLALDWLSHRNVIPMDLVSDLARLGGLDEKAQVVGVAL
jgi:hypothetical protein